MSVTLGLTEDQTIAALRSFLLSILPSAVEVVKGQDNQVAAPASDDYITMTPIMRERLETNVTTYIDAYPVPPQSRMDMQPTKVTVQLDIHGPNSADNTQIITTLFRSDYAATKFGLSGVDVTPLYASEPRQLPFLNDSQQIENRWTVDIAMQANPVVTSGQDFAGAVTIDLIEVDAAYPP